MTIQLRGYAIRIAGFLYGIVGYGLSIVTYILGATIGPLFFPLIKRAALKLSMGSDTTVPAQGSDLRRSRRPKKRSSRHSKTPHGHDPDSLAGTHGKLVPDDMQLRHATSLDSFRGENSFVLIAPVITINHVDRVDNMSIKAPTITLYPGARRDSGERQSSKRRSATISHQPLPPLLLSTEDSPIGAASALSNLETSWNDKSRIHRSASSPQLVSCVEKELSTSEPKRKEKIQLTGLSGKGGKKSTRQEKVADSVAYPTPPLRFFSNIVKKRSHTLRTQPYNEPYSVPLPVPPFSRTLKTGKEIQTQ